MGGAKLSAVLNNARMVMEHLLKLQHARRSIRAGWRATVRSTVPARIDLTPRLRQILDEELTCVPHRAQERV